MRSLRTLLPALVLGAVSLAFVGVSAALEGDDPGTPEEPTTTEVPDCTTATTTAETETDGTLPEVDDECGDVTDGTDVDADDGEIEDESPDDTVPDESAPEEQPANHGAAVSEAAHTCPPGPEHGKCVSEVARSDAGKPGDDEVDGDDADEVQDEAEEPTAPGGGKGHGRGNGHGHG